MPSPSEITVPQLSRLVGLPGAPALLDMRPAEEFNTEPLLLPAARQMPFCTVASWGGSYAGQRVVVYCRDGREISQGTAAWLRHGGIDAQTLAGGFQAWREADAPLMRTDRLPERDAAGRTTWVTRARPKIIRIACPWLIRRFIDPKAAFLFVAPSEVPAVAERFKATPFDTGQGLWNDRGGTCTFDVMLEEFNLQTEALSRLALIVRGADIPGGSICRRNRRACWRPRSAIRACTGTIACSSTPLCRCTTRSTAGAGTPRKRRTADGPHRPSQPRSIPS